VLLVFGAPGQLKTLAGLEHGRTIPLADILSCRATSNIVADGTRAPNLKCDVRSAMPLTTA
jgi:hypothetical protein